MRDILSATQGRATLAPHLQGANLANIEKVGSLFEGTELCKRHFDCMALLGSHDFFFLNMKTGIFHLKDDPDGDLKRKFEEQVAAQRGTIVQSPMSTTTAVVADNKGCFLKHYF